MNLTPVIHPPLLGELARAGHGSLVLIADGNYPVATGIRPRASTIYLNVRPGLIDAVTVLAAVLELVPVEAAAVMVPAGVDPDIFVDFEAALPGITLQRLQRAEFYAAARSEDLAVVIATGEIRHFGNILLTMGVVPVGIDT